VALTFYPAGKNNYRTTCPLPSVFDIAPLTLAHLTIKSARFNTSGHL
jgi:hypothetical protein